MSLKERIRGNPELYAIFGTVTFLAPLIMGGIYFELDSRHDMKGSSKAVEQKLAAEITKTEVQALEAVESAIEQSTQNLLKAEIRQLKRDKREKMNLERLSPSSTYSASRQAEIAALTDEIEELERELAE